MPPQRPTIAISKKTIAIVGVLLTFALAIPLVARFLPARDAAIFTPAQHAAQGLATMDIYLRPDDYKSDLTWSAYQQILALSPQYLAQNRQDPYNATVTKFGSLLILDDHVFGDSVNALVQTYVKSKSGSTSLMEFQLQMVPDGKDWKVNNVTTLIKGEVPTAVAKTK